MIRPGCRRWRDLGYLTVVFVVPATIRSPARAVRWTRTGRPGSGPSNPGRSGLGLARSRLSARALVIFPPLPAWRARNDRRPLHRQETRRPDARQGRTARTLGQHRGTASGGLSGQRTHGFVAISPTGRTGRWDPVAAGRRGPAAGEPGAPVGAARGRTRGCPSGWRPDGRGPARAGRGTPSAAAGVPAGPGGGSRCPRRLSHLYVSSTLDAWVVPAGRRVGARIVRAGPRIDHWRGGAPVGPGARTMCVHRCASTSAPSQQT
jgi:hypothetical protein